MHTGMRVLSQNGVGHAASATLDPNIQEVIIASAMTIRCCRLFLTSTSLEKV